MQLAVSLTSIDSRAGILRYCIDSLVRQALPPDVIYLNLSREAYLLDDGISEAPRWLSEPGYQNVKLNWVDNDGPYRKLLPAMALSADDDLVVTVDDDQIYAENWLGKLVDAAMKYPDHVICGRAQRPKKNIFSGYQSYPNWDVVERSFRGADLIPTGNAGILYRKSLLDLDFLFDENRLTIAPTSDDLWVREASFRMSCPVLVVGGLANDRFRFRGGKSLASTNTKLGRFKGRVRRGITNNFLVRKPALYLGLVKTNNDLSYLKIKHYSSSLGPPCSSTSK